MRSDTYLAGVVQLITQPGLDECVELMRAALAGTVPTITGAVTRQIVEKALVFIASEGITLEEMENLQKAGLKIRGANVISESRAPGRSQGS